MHNFYSKLIKNFEINNNFFEREKILNKFFTILNSSPFYFPHKSLKFFDDKPLNKNLRIYFFLEITILSLLYHHNIDEYLDLYLAFKHCLFYLNQNFVILTYYIVEKLEKIDLLKKDPNFQNFNLNYTNKSNNLIILNETKTEENINTMINYNDKNITEDGNLLQKEYVKLCSSKLEENKIWLDKNSIFKNFNENNKKLLNLAKNILEILINIQNKKNEYLVIYYEIKDTLYNFNKIKLDVTLDNMNHNVNNIFLIFSAYQKFM